MTIARVAVPVPVDRCFDYWVPEGIPLVPGALVRVRFGTKRCVGVVVDTPAVASVDRADLVPIDGLVDLPPLPRDVIDVANFVAGYYRAPLGEALALAVPPLGERSRERPRPRLPDRVALADAGRVALDALAPRAVAARALRDRLAASPAGFDAAALAAPERRRLLAWWQAGWLLDGAIADAPAMHDLNPAQREAIDAIDAALGRYAAFLLDGVTGSGKTDVYAQAAARALGRGGQVLVLVPEIHLTPQLAARFARALPGRRIVTLHSALVDGERRARWLAAENGEADLVLGTRLAVFAPLPRLALVVVDEEHDASFKQQEGVRYHARDAAIWRAHARDVPIVLGSATPSLESLAAARRGRYRRLALPERADPRARPPAVRLVPPDDARGGDGLGTPLAEAIRVRLERGEQSLVFVNRRGYAPSLKCSACAWEAGCPRCSARLVLHREPPRLACHHCGHVEAVPRTCPSCGNLDLTPRGHGTQRLEGALAERFPGARIARVDRDSTRRRGAFDELRQRVSDDALDILVGTQMLAKGHDFPRLTLVGVLGADNALYSADFRAVERLAALLFQVAGRAGRAALPGEVLVQTAFPAHPVYAALVGGDYALVADRLLDERRGAALPPFAHLALLSAEALARADVTAFLDAARDDAVALQREGDGDVEVHAPVAALLARKAGHERAQLCVQAGERVALRRFLDRWMPMLRERPSRRVRWALDVDPVSL